jgi:SdrD B-like domain
MALSFAAVLLAASPVLAHHISGTVYCDQDLDGTIDAGDTPVSGIDILITSIDAQPGQMFSQTTDANGAYNIGLPARTDRYTVEIENLPAGFTIVIPGGGTYTIQIITNNSQLDHKDGVDFLLQGCGHHTTTTTKPTTSTTSTTTTTTPPTTAPVCQCDQIPFLAAREGKINNDASVGGSVGVNNPGARLRFGKNVILADGTVVEADTVQIGNASSVDNVLANTLIKGAGVTIRGTTGPATLPIIQPFCSIPAITCGTSTVQVAPGASVGPLPPGAYGKLKVLNGGTLSLQAGTFTFCDVKLGRSAALTTQGPAIINVAGDVVIGTASHFGPAAGTAPVSVNVAGKLVRVSQSAFANASFVAPHGRITFGRDSHLVGCFCTDREKSDKHITLECPAPLQ